MIREEIRSTGEYETCLDKTSWAIAVEDAKTLVVLFSSTFDHMIICENVARVDLKAGTPMTTGQVVKNCANGKFAIFGNEFAVIAIEDIGRGACAAGAGA